jgi:hypothetical protein
MGTLSSSYSCAEQRTDAAAEPLILAERRQHRTCGPEKRQVVLGRMDAIERPLACRTTIEISRSHDSSVTRHRRSGAFPVDPDKGDALSADIGYTLI